MRVGLFGGSFNPPHLAHLIVAEGVREQFGFDRIWWVPAFSPPHKTNEGMAAPEHRLAMTRLTIAGNPAFDLCDLEIQREGTSYTVDTVRHLQEAYPELSFTLIIGGDSLRDFETWHRPDEIVKRVPLVAYQRPGARTEDVPHRFSSRVRFAEAPELEISGTDIRRRVREGRSIRYLVAEPVRAYILQHDLYRPA